MASVRWQMKNRINFHHPALLSADRESKQQPTSRFQPIKNAFWGTTEHQRARARAQRTSAASEPRSCRSPQMICLLRCISRELCCTSILQHPREPRPLARKASAPPQRKTSALFTDKRICRHVQSESWNKGKKTGLAPTHPHSCGQSSSTATNPME